MNAPLWFEKVATDMRLPAPHPAFDCSPSLVAGYAELFDARHPIHIDAEFARTSRFGRCIAHGPLPVAKALGMLGDIFGVALVAMTSIDEWRFFAPVFVGYVVSVEAFVLDAQPSAGGSSGIVTVEMRLSGPDGSLAQRGVARLLVRRDPARGGA